MPETWFELVERVRQDHNGVMRLDLYFGHDGHYVCRFSNYDKQLAEGESGRSMQEAVERCYANWRLVNEVDFATKHGDLYEICPECGRQDWTHQHPHLYGNCESRKGQGA